MRKFICLLAIVFMLGACVETHDSPEDKFEDCNQSRSEFECAFITLGWIMAH